MDLTRSEMVSVAKAAGFERVSEHLVADWAKDGLLAPGRHVGRGPGGGRGARYEWSPQQLNLFLLLLKQRDAGNPLKAMLASFPVAFWVYMPTTDIPLIQAKRALRTWWHRASRTTWDRALQIGREVAETLAQSDTPRTAVSELKEIAAGAADRADYPREMLLEWIEECGIREYRVDGHPVTPELQIDLMWSMVTAMNHLDECADDVFYDARRATQCLRMQYFMDYFDPSRRSRIGPNPEPPTKDLLINKACYDVLSSIGIDFVTAPLGRTRPAVAPPHADPHQFFNALPEAAQLRT